MSHTNPMGWAKMTHEKVRFTGENPHYQTLCIRLTEIFVDKMAIARNVSIEMDVESGEKTIHFLVDHNSPIRHMLSEREIMGIPLKFTISEETILL